MGILSNRHASGGHRRSSLDPIMSSVAVTTFYDNLGLILMLWQPLCSTHKSTLSQHRGFIHWPWVSFSLSFSLSNFAVLRHASHPGRNTGLILTAYNLCSAHFPEQKVSLLHSRLGSGPHLHLPVPRSLLQLLLHTVQRLLLTPGTLPAEHPSRLLPACRMKSRPRERLGEPLQPHLLARSQPRP